MKQLKPGYIGILVIMPLTTAAFVLLTQASLAAALLVTMGFASWAVSKFRLQFVLMMLIAIVLPLSAELPITAGLNMRVPSEPLLGVAVLTMVWDVLEQPGLLRHLFEKEGKWILPLMACLVLTTLFSTLIKVSVKFSLVNITCILVFYVWLKYLVKDRPDFFIKLMGLYSLSVFAVLAYAIYRYYQYQWNPVTVKGIFRPFYKDNTLFGATSALLAVFWLGYAGLQKRIGRKFFYMMPGIIFLLSVLLSRSRAAALSLFLFPVVLLAGMLGLRLKHVAMIIAVLILMIVLFRNKTSQYLLGDEHLSHVAGTSYLEQLQSSGNISSDISNLERINRWTSGIAMFMDRPWTGFGPGTFQFAYIPYQKPQFRNRLSVSDPWHIPENSGGTAHSEYILALSEMGIAGLLTFLIFLGRLTVITFSKQQNELRRPIMIIAFAALATYIFHAFFNNFLSTDAFAFLFWGLAAMLMSHYETLTDHGKRILSTGRDLL